MGIPLDEVFNYVSGKMKQVDTLNFELRLAGQGALKRALTKLSKLAAGGQRAAESKEIGLGPNGPKGTIEKFVSDDLEAAKALAKFGIDALKLAKAGLAPKSDDPKSQPDLFDSSDPWKLKKID